MNNVLSSMQMLKSSEIKNKFSKSVSHETLVIGAATIGRECGEAPEIEGVITRRTSVRRGYLPEQGTHANKESLFASVTCFMRLPRRIQRMLLVMTIPALALILTLITIGESLADDGISTSGTCNDAGTCLWSIDSAGTLTISAKEGAKDVKMDNYVCYDDTLIGNRPWENYIIQIKDIVVEENITNIGDEAFQGAFNIKTVTGMKNVKSIGYDSFAAVDNLTQIETPAVEYLASYSLAVGGLTSIDLPNIKTIEARAFAHVTALQYVGLPVDENGNPLNVNIADGAFADSSLKNCSNENRAACGSCGNGYVMSGLGCVSDCGAGYLGKEGRCIDASNGCGAGYRQFENFCNRIRYTPAEAAKVLRDDNTNEVTITFKK